MMKQTALGVILMAKTACTSVPPLPPEEEENIPVYGETGYTCAQGRAQALVGRTASAELGAEALRLTGSRSLRWIRPGDAVTMDYREDRLNIHLGPQNRVTRLTCG